MATARQEHPRVSKRSRTQGEVEPSQAAREAGLRYVDDRRPGFTRLRAGKRFRYVDTQGRTIRDAETLARIRALAIPPAWQHVWICPSPLGHIQATGRDDKGRKQYRYHPRWRTCRDQTNYGRMIAFGQALPRIRKRTEKDLALPGLPRRKVVATVVRLLESTLIRVGNEEYVRKNGSFGLTTMQDRHIKVNGTGVRFAFPGKSGVFHTIDLHDRRLARIVKRCQDLPGQELFQYVDSQGKVRDIDSADVNDYLREVTGEEFTAKDFRTWAGTVLATMALREFESFDTKAQAKKNIVRAIESVSARLGNRPAICRKSYVHPAVIDSYLDGSMLDTLQQRTAQEMSESMGSLRPEEAAVLVLLQNRLARERRHSRSA